MFKTNNMKFTGFVLVLVFAFLSIKMQAQQDPEYTQYMYNTMSVNPAYAGSKNHTVINALARSQWVGVDGSPETQTLSYDTTIKYTGLGLGVNLVNDKLGPATETYLDANVSYAIQVIKGGYLNFGLKLGGRLFNVDWSKGKYKFPDRAFNQNIENKFLPTLGAGLFYYTDKFYVGAAIPNFLNTDHYDIDIENVAVEEKHIFVITGYVFDLNDDIKFKPAALFKGVVNAPFSLDVSANFLFKERFRAGLAYRLDDSISALLGFQVNKGLHIGYAYDLTTSKYAVYNSGTHEVMLRYEIFRKGPIKSPRFF